MEAKTREVEPLQDTVPPRHQIESDESEDEDLDTHHNRQLPPTPLVNINWIDSYVQKSNVLVALHEAGQYWAQGVILGDIHGKLILNTIEIGNFYTPQWADVLVIIITTRVPLYAMHTIASTIISCIQPKCLSMIDSYPLPSCILPLPQKSNKQPIRYLQTYRKLQLPSAELFSPPNMLQSLAAAFLPLAEFKKLPSTLLLLPSSHMTPPTPPRIISSPFGPPIREEWEPRVMEEFHRNLDVALGSQSTWKVNKDTSGFGKVRPLRRGDVGEGGMYL
ncbi:hypothetical protein Clacol_007292 [Clathrus columnatus]|uniref:Uncharacterized protein n=1 Tax=Clathrus columnatus TaxID=1419009 RepID=A0AAV5AIU4_9AGAM|nr:hypothetical protein Clacol_007292 [Clathrus columnatus]